MLDERSTLWAKPLAITLSAILLLCAGLLPASSRMWKPTPEKLALDYATIDDARPSGDLIFLMWFAAPIVRPDVPNAAQVRALLEQYVFLAAAEGHLDKTIGVISFGNIDALEAKDDAGTPLTAVERAGMPPTTVGAVTIVERMFQQALGAMGKGMKMFVFDAGNVHACKKGSLSVPFAGETYTWETPLPGCS